MLNSSLYLFLVSAGSIRIRSHSSSKVIFDCITGLGIVMLEFSYPHSNESFAFYVLDRRHTSNILGVRNHQNFREMATSAKILAPDKPNSAEDWTVVLPRRGKQKRNYHKVIIRDREKQEQTWTPADIETNPERESKLMQKIQTCMKKLESSPFWLTFSDQLQTPEIFDWFLKFGGSEGKMQMVIYGIGSVESYEPPRLQLSLAILMKRMFSWIGEVEVFDPVISLAESRVLAALGCSVLTVNEQGRRQALRPTMFFMPHCEAELYDNLLEANWRADLLNNIVLFGNSFEAYEQHLSVCKNLTLADSRKHILAIRQFVKEYGINSFSDDFFRAFHGSSWHFFNIDSHTDLCDAKP